MVIKGYAPSEFISTGEKPRNEQTFKQNFKLVMENCQNETQKKENVLQASDGEAKKLVDNYVARNTKKSTKYAGTI